MNPASAPNPPPPMRRTNAMKTAIVASVSPYKKSLYATTPGSRWNTVYFSATYAGNRRPLASTQSAAVAIVACRTET